MYCTYPFPSAVLFKAHSVLLIVLYDSSIFLGIVGLLQTVTRLFIIRVHHVSFLLFSVFSAPRIRFHFSFRTIVILDRLEYHVELFHMHMLHRGFHSVGLCANRD